MDWITTRGLEPDLKQLFPGLHELTDREEDLVACHGVRLPSPTPAILEVSQNLDRTTAPRSISGCIMPRWRSLLLHRCRFALGIEGFALQSIHYGSQHLALADFPNSLLSDLAGNAFSTDCCAASFVVGLALVSWCSNQRRACLLAHMPRQPVEDLEDSLWGVDKSDAV